MSGPDVPRLHTVAEYAEDRCTVTVTGELDLLTGPVLLQRLDIAATGARHLSLDVAQLSFCDIAGLRALLRAQQRARERGIRLTVCNTTSHFAWLLHITGTAGQLLGDDSTDDEAAADDDRPPALPALRAPEAGPGAAESADERDQELLDQERGRLLDERAHRIGEQQRWEDIREDLANIRERDLERREGTDTEPPGREVPRQP